MFETFLYKQNDRYKIFEEEDLKIRLALSKPLLVQKVWYYILLITFFIFSYKVYYNSSYSYYDYLPMTMDAIKLAIYLPIAISIITVLVRSVYWYKINLEKTDESKYSIYTKTIIKKWIILIFNIALVYSYMEYVFSSGVGSTLFIIILSLNIGYLILKLVGNKIRVAMLREGLAINIENINEKEVKLKNKTDHLDAGSDEEMIFGVKYRAIVNKLKLLLLKLEETTLKENASITSKSQLITNLSHDLKTPLTSIINSTYILKTETLNEEEILEQIDILKNKTRRLNSLIDNMNEVINSDEEAIVLNKENVNIAYLLEDTIENFKNRLEENNLHLRINIENDIIANVDKDKTTRIFENLLDNIIKYSLEDTRIYIDLSQKEENIEISFKNISKYDIDTSEDMLTNRFVKGDKSRNSEGYGLGLSIVNNLVKVQGGKVKVEVEGDLFKALITFKALENNIV